MHGSALNTEDSLFFMLFSWRNSMKIQMLSVEMG